MNKSFFRKVAFGLSPDDVIPTDPLTWAQNQFDTVPECASYPLRYFVSIFNINIPLFFY